MQDRGINPNQLAKKSAINNAQIYKLLDEKRQFRINHLEAIAKVFGVEVGDLIREPPKVPFVGTIQNGCGPPQKEIKDPTEGNHREFSITGDELSQMYAMKVEDRSLMPVIHPDAFLYAQRGTSKRIKNEDMVIYWKKLHKNLRFIQENATNNNTIRNII